MESIACKTPALGLSDDQVWSRFRAVIITGAVSLPVLWPPVGPDGFTIAAGPTREACLDLLQKHQVQP